VIIWGLMIEMRVKGALLASLDASREKLLVGDEEPQPTPSHVTEAMEQNLQLQ
jgi:hypothetical protein